MDETAQRGVKRAILSPVGHGTTIKVSLPIDQHVVGEPVISAR
jgi:hypothetical protein